MKSLHHNAEHAPDFANQLSVNDDEGEYHDIPVWSILLASALLAIFACVGIGHTVASIIEQIP